MNNNYTTKLEETIYFGNEKDLTNINKQINLFFKELINRKRNNPIEGGLQASMVIFPDRFAAKICEHDGNGVHIINEVNLTKFLFSDSNFLNEEASRYFGLYMDYMVKINREGITIRILDGETKLMLAITSPSNLQSLFEIDIIKIIIDICRQIKINNLYKELEVGLNLSNITIEFDDFNDNKYQMFINVLEQEKTKMRSK